MVAARPGTPGDAILGVAAREVVEPASLEEAAEALRACAADRRAVAFAGGGTDLELGAPPRALDVLLRTSYLSRVVEHLPDDQVVTVEAGVTLAALGRVLAPHRQRLALDPPFPARATAGGVVAAGAYGPHRTRFGAARDLVLGVTLVRADGTVARGGSKVVKNVAGFDLPRLMVGSCGTLALVAAITFRLHPLPEAACTVVVEGLAPDAVRAVARAVIDAQLEPAAAAAFTEGGPLRVALSFEGFGPGVDEMRDRLLALAARAGWAAAPLGDDAAGELWARHAAIRGEGRLRARLSALPAAFAGACESAVRPLLAALEPGRAVVDPLLGVGSVSGEPRSDDAAARAVEEARAALARLGGTLVLAAAPPGVRARVDVWGPVPAPALALMRRLKERLDPEGRLAPGRFVGGL